MPRTSPGADYPHRDPGPPMDWRHDAACKDQPSHWWYPERRASEYAQRAITICNRCPTKTDCLEWALATQEPHGIWGGMGEIERRRELSRRERAASTTVAHNVRTPYPNGCA